MLKVHLITMALVMATAVHALVALMALINFMWLTAALASIVTVVGAYLIDGIDKEFYQ